MSYYTFTGGKVYVQSTLASAITITDLTNDNPPVATLTSHGLSNDDELVCTSSGWEEVQGSVFRIANVATNTFELDGIDTSSTDFYPATSADSSVFRKVTAWTQIGQVLDISGGGGGVRNITVNPLDRRTPVILPVGFEASTLEMVLGYDPALTAQIALQSASRSLAKRAVKFQLPGGAFAYGYGTVSLSPLPTFSSSDVMRRNFNMSIDGLFTFYSS